jgi:drug/metabolite transporter (DMT)-like permease
LKAWLLLSVIIAATVTADLLQSHEMKRHGEIHDFGPSGLRRVLATLARKTNLILAVACMAVSFFAFMALVQVADLSFAVPASAGSLVIETVLARLILKEHVDWRRWIGAALVAGGVWLLAL